MAVKTLGELAQILEGDFAGDPNLEIHQVVHPTQAHSAHDLALLLDKSIISNLGGLTLQTVLLPQNIDVPQIPNRLMVKRPKVALAKLLEIYDKPIYVNEGVHPSAVIDPSVSLGQGVSIGPLCSVGPGTVIGAGTKLIANVTVGAHAVVGENALLYPGAFVGDRVILGNRVILHANAAIGNDGFSFVTPEAGSVESARATGRVESQNTQILKINSIGTVVLEDDVEIGANSCVDRATLGETRLKRGTKIDNQVQIAHNVIVGENCLMAAQVGIAGSVTLGDRVVMAGQAGVKDHTTIGDDVIVMPKTGVIKDIPAKTILTGTHGVPHREFLRREMNMKRASALPAKMKELTERLEALEKQLQTEVGQPV